MVGGTELDTSGLVQYQVEIGGERLQVDETRIVPTSRSSGDVLDSFDAQMWRGAFRFALRRALRENEADSGVQTEGLTCLLGARIKPLPHQIYAVRRVLSDRLPRFILADEVGLGKTIEAGLVIQSLMTRSSDLRILVVAPGAMSRQWHQEMYLRFGAWPYKHVDMREWRASSPSHRLSLVGAPRLIVSTSLLADDRTLRDELLARQYDMVVIDEAHHYPPGSTLYSFFQALSLRTDGLLVLSGDPIARSRQWTIGSAGTRCRRCLRPC